MVSPTTMLILFLKLFLKHQNLFLGWYCLYPGESIILKINICCIF